jgi:hypothetical protein
MNKIKQFFKKYGVWFLVGILIGAIIFVIFFLNRKQEDEIVLDLPIEPITSPYIQTQENVDIITNNIQIENFQEREWIYSITRPEETLLANFIDNFYNIQQQEFSMQEEIIITQGNDLVWYNANIGILSIFSDGLVLDLKITNARDISSFFTQYLGIRQVINDKITPTDRGTLYTGYFEYHGKKIGSSNLEGYSYKLELDKNERLIEFSMLFLREENLQRYQAMPTIPLSELLDIRNYPMKIVNQTIEDYFYNQPDIIRGSASLSTLTAKEIDNLFVFNDLEDQYIIPTYRILGDGELVDSKGGRYWTISNIFICAIDPEFLLEKPVETYREQPHTDPPS